MREIPTQPSPWCRDPIYSRKTYTSSLNFRETQYCIIASKYVTVLLWLNAYKVKTNISINKDCWLFPQFSFTQLKSLSTEESLNLGLHWRHCFLNPISFTRSGLVLGFELPHAWIKKEPWKNQSPTEAYI